MAAVCAVFVVASLVVERGLEHLGHQLKKKKRKQLLHTLGKIKDELMLLGFISLSLTVFQSKIASICMPERLNKFMLPCPYKAGAVVDATAAAGHRRLLATSSPVTCPSGQVQVISVSGLHQLHIFIFVMAIVHVIYSAATVLLGLWQVHEWKSWETQSVQQYDICFEKALGKKPNAEVALEGRMRYKFLQSTRTGYNISRYIYSFFKQFGKPISKQDYWCLRYGFITFHNLDPKFDFHGYIKRSIEIDFQHVVGISYYLWAFVCIYLLVDIHGWYSYFWLAFIPLAMILFVGAKLQLIVTALVVGARRKAKDNDMRGECVLSKITGIKTCPAISPRDELFWFRSPRLLLFLLHFILFQNAFELAFFFWTMFTYGYSSCLVGKTWMVVVRILVGLFLQILCSVSTLPLYALVTQLGSKMKLTVFRSESTGVALKGWAKSAKKRHSHPDHVHVPISPNSSISNEEPHVTKKEHHLHVLGLDKQVDAGGHVVDIVPGTTQHLGQKHQHNDHNHLNGDDHHQNPKPVHVHAQGDSHTTEVAEDPGTIVNESQVRVGDRVPGNEENKS